MKTIKELEEIRKNMIDDVTLRKEHNATNVSVAMGTCGIAAGAREVTNAFLEEISKMGIKNVTVTQTGCIKNCDLEPIVEVCVPGKDKVTYVKMTPEKVKKVVNEHLAKGNVVSEFLK